MIFKRLNILNTENVTLIDLGDGNVIVASAPQVEGVLPELSKALFFQNETPVLNRQKAPKSLKVPIGMLNPDVIIKFSDEHAVDALIDKLLLLKKSIIQSKK